MKCSCNAWRENIPKLDAQQIFCANQLAAPKWDGECFTYCPWCGKRLHDAEFIPVIKTAREIQEYSRIADSSSGVGWRLSLPGAAGE